MSSIDDAVIEWEELDFLERVYIKSKSEKSFLNFTRIWFEILQGQKLMVNWHHKLMAHKTEQLLKGELKPGSLIINIPPGGTKTEFFSIHLPAYTNTLVQCGKLRRFRNLNISFADTLVKRNSRRTRDIISSKEYQELWPCTFGANQAEEWQVVNLKGKVVGETVSRAAGGQITGGRGGYTGWDYTGHVGLDDYNKPEDMFSETKRESSNRKLVNTIRSRRGDKSQDHPTPFLSIQQRLHVDDATGFMLSGGMGIDFHHVVVPALISEDYLATLSPEWREECWNAIKDSDSVVKGGVRYWSYWPEMESVHDLIKLWERDEYTFLSQYMQNPKALSGGLIDSDWFPTYKELPVLVWRGVYVDTNSGKVNDHNDFTVFTHAGLGKDGKLYIIDVERGKWDPEDLLQKAEEVWNRWKPWTHKYPANLRYMAIEDKQAGQGLITTLKKRNRIPVKEIPRGPDQNKLVRCKDCIPHFKPGNVLIPALHDEDGNKIDLVVNNVGDVVGKTDWVITALAEAAAFSADDSHKNDDILDTWFDAVFDMLIDSGSTDWGAIL
ncbi:phage terminase large subunit [Vibrio phage vB_VpP_1]|nr:phage terminase large subunit [Vibrio phage vB_VpP_1]